MQSANFLASKRVPLHDNIEDLPGPQEYDTNQTIFKNKRKSGKGKPFNLKEKRFRTVDQNVPGAGAYSVPSTIQVADPERANASYISNIDKSWDIVVGRDNPGIGEYNT